MNSMAALKSSRVHLLLQDYAELTKAGVTTLIIVTAACGFFFAAKAATVPWFTWRLFHALLGIGLVSSGTAALNEVIEHNIDRNMKRTARRPLPAGRMSLLHGAAAGLLLTIGGSLYLLFLTNLLTGVLTFLTSAVYLAIYTPLKRVSPVCTAVGAVPGAMPGVLGWAAVGGHLDWGALVLFAIMFLWQFPHFFSIAWLYRDDYANGGIRMLPVVDPDGRSTARRILLYSLVLVPASILPSFLGMTGKVYMLGAALLSLSLLYFGARLALSDKPLASGASKLCARHLLQATVFYLPLLFALMMANASRP